MRFYADKENRKITRIICNCCGRELKVFSGHAEEGVLHVEKDWGYFSKKDGILQEADVCEECWEEITKKFCIPVTETEALEY